MCSHINVKCCSNSPHSDGMRNGKAIRNLLALAVCVHIGSLTICVEIQYINCLKMSRKVSIVSFEFTHCPHVCGRACIAGIGVTRKNDNDDNK